MTPLDQYVLSVALFSVASSIAVCVATQSFAWGVATWSILMTLLVIYHGVLK